MSRGTFVSHADPQQSTTWWAENAGDSLPFDFAADAEPYNLARLRQLDFDTTFVDTPGSLEDTRVLSALLDVADFAILPFNPEALNTPAMVRTIRQQVAPRGISHRVLLSKIDRRRAGQLEDWEKLVDEGLKLPRFRQYIRLYAAHADAPLRGRECCGSFRVELAQVAGKVFPRADPPPGVAESARRAARRA